MTASFSPTMPPTASSLGLRGELQKLEVQKLNLTPANKDGNGRGFVPPYHMSGWRGFNKVSLNPLISFQPKNTLYNNAVVRMNLDPC